jgi:hypothetical protein
MPNRFRNSVPAFALAATTFATAGTLFGVFFPEFALHAVKVVVGEVVSFSLVGLLGWGAWIFYEQKKYDGWHLEVTNLDETTDRDPVPPTVIKRWIQSRFSGFGQHGWRDIVATLDIRDNGCPPIKCDAWQAHHRGALVVDVKRKVVQVSYPRMKDPAPLEGELDDSIIPDADQEVVVRGADLKVTVVTSEPAAAIGPPAVPTEQ